MSEHMMPIPSRLYNAAVGGHVAGTDQIIDDNENKEQSQINAEVKQILGQGGSVDLRISSAINAAKSEIKGNATSACDTLGEAEALITAEVTTRNNAVNAESSRAQAVEQLLQEQYNALTQSDIIIGALPASGTKNKIYRVPGTTSYSDYMWNGSSFIKMAEYDNAIDDEPTAGSDNLVKSRGVYLANNKIKGLIGSEYIPDFDSFTNVWVNISTGVVEAINSQNACLFKVNAGQTLSIVNKQMNDAIRYGVFSSKPAIGSIAESYERIETVKDTPNVFTFDDDVYFMFSYYYEDTGYEFIIEPNEGIIHDIERLNNEIQVGGIIPNSEVLKQTWINISTGVVETLANQDSVIFLVNKGDIVRIRSNGGAVRYAMFDTKPQIGSTTDVCERIPISMDAYYDYECQISGYIMISYYNGGTPVIEYCILHKEQESLNKHTIKQIGYTPNPIFFANAYINLSDGTLVNDNNNYCYYFRVKAGDKLHVVTSDAVRYGFCDADTPVVSPILHDWDRIELECDIVVASDGFFVYSRYKTIDVNILILGSIDEKINEIEKHIDISPVCEIKESDDIRADSINSQIDVILTSKNSVFRLNKGSLVKPNIGMVCSVFVDFGNDKIGFYVPYANENDKNTTIWKEQASTYSFVEGHKYQVQLQKIKGDIAKLIVTDLHTFDTTEMETLPADCYNCGIAHCWGYDTAEIVSGSLSIGDIKVSTMQKLTPKLMIIGDSNVDHGGVGADKRYAYSRLIKNEFEDVAIFAQGGGNMTNFVDWYKNFIRYNCKSKYCLISTANDHSLSIYKTKAEELISMLSQNNIIPILATIHPNGENRTTIEPAQKDINDWIRSSGYMYFDLAEIISVNNDSETVASLPMLNPDKVHFTTVSNPIIANRFKLDYGYIFENNN